MTTSEAEKMKEIFSQRLQTLMSENNVAQTELSYLLGMDRSTVNKWIMKKALPRMAIIEKLSSYFGVEKSYFLDENADTNMRSYYLDPETAMLAQELKDNPQYRVLLDSTKKLKPEAVQEVMKFIDYQLAKEKGGLDE